MKSGIDITAAEPGMSPYGKLPFNDDPGSRFELARDEDEDGLDWADRERGAL